MKARTITLQGEVYEVTIHRRSPSLWVAIGVFRGERLEARGSSERSAIGQWKVDARLSDTTSTLDGERPHRRLCEVLARPRTA